MHDPRQTARTLIEHHDVTLDHLWVMYWAEGGSAPLPNFEAFLYEAQEPAPFDLEILTWAIEDIEGEDTVWW